jgi:hypothetical protein
MLIVLAGWLLNAAAIVPNAGMPVSSAALRSAGTPPGYSMTRGHLSKHVTADHDRVLRPLGDVIGVSFGNQRGVVFSIGDIFFLMIGLCVILVSAMGSSEKTEPSLA